MCNSSWAWRVASQPLELHDRCAEGLRVGGAAPRVVVGCATWMDGSVRNIAAIAKRGRVEGKEPCGKELCEGSLLFQRKDQVGHATEAKATRRSPASIILCCQREIRRTVGAITKPPYVVLPGAL